LSAPRFAAFSRARASMSPVMSTPITWPIGPTRLNARKASNPAPGRVEYRHARLDFRKR
jgi:hypothetical protein